MSSDILVGISTYNDYEYLEMLLQSIRWYTYNEDHDFDLVVCDDGTRMRNVQEDLENPGVLVLDPAAVEMADKTRDVAARFGATYIEHSRNLGIPSAWNSLANALGAQSKYIVILNNDIIVPPQWLEVAIHFLRENYDNPHVGSCYWNPVNRVDKEMMRTILPLIGHTAFTTEDIVSGKELDFTGHSHTKVQVGAGQGLGKVMCPCGCCFALTREVWNEFGPFPVEYRSFHEESFLGTNCARGGRASFGFAYPRPYHTHGYTFSVSPELQAGERMRSSRAMYRADWGVPDNVEDYFGWTHEKFMSQIPPTRLKYLRPDYSQEPEERTLPGGEKVKLPRLVEFEEEF